METNKSRRDAGATSTAEQVRRKALERLHARNGAEVADPAETVTLPSGLTFAMLRPRPLWWALRGRLPASLAARVGGESPSLRSSPDGRSAEELAELSQWIVELLEEVVIEPKIRLNPSPEEADPNWLSEDDLLFIMRYAGGEVQADGSDLSRFPGSGSSSAAGPGGADLQLPPEPDAGDRGSRSDAD